MSELTWKQMHEAAVEFQADLQDKLSASQAREAALREKLEAAEARIKASQNPDFYLSGDGYWVRGEDYEDRPDKHRFTEAAYRNPQTPSELAELQRENAELRKLLEESKVPEDVLFRVVEVAHMAGQRNQGHCDPSAYEALVYWNTYKLQILDLLGVKPQPKEPKQ